MTENKDLAKRAHMQPDRLAARAIIRKALRATYTHTMPEKIVAMMMTGKTRRECAAAMGIHPNTFRAWMKDPEKEEFQWAVELGDELCYQWWMNTLRDIVSGKKEKYNATLWIFTAKNLFGWRDTQESIVHNNALKVESRRPNLKQVLDSIDAEPVKEVKPKKPRKRKRS